MFKIRKSLAILLLFLPLPLFAQTVFFSGGMAKPFYRNYQKGPAFGNTKSDPAFYCSTGYIRNTDSAFFTEFEFNYSYRAFSTHYGYNNMANFYHFDGSIYSNAFRFAISEGVVIGARGNGNFKAGFFYSFRNDHILGEEEGGIGSGNTYSYYHHYLNKNTTNLKHVGDLGILISLGRTFSFDKVFKLRISANCFFNLLTEWISAEPGGSIALLIPLKSNISEKR